jgi:hypothetical protein
MPPMSYMTEKWCQVIIFGITIVLSIVTLDLNRWITPTPGLHDWNFAVSVTSVSVLELKSTWVAQYFWFCYGIAWSAVRLGGKLYFWTTDTSNNPPAYPVNVVIDFLLCLLDGTSLGGTIVSLVQMYKKSHQERANVPHFEGKLAAQWAIPVIDGLCLLLFGIIMLIIDIIRYQRFWKRQKTQNGSDNGNGDIPPQEQNDPRLPNGQAPELDLIPGNNPIQLEHF